MKRLALLIFTIFTYVSAFADQPDFGGSDVPLDKEPTIHNGSTRPRSLEQSDITACYNQAVLTIDIRRDLGNAFIVVSNYTTGDVWSDSVSGIATLSMLLSGDEGYYVINIYTDEGDYVGEFYL